MTSRQFTVDPVKKQEFINIFLLMPETRVSHAMRKAEFAKKDIANLLLRHFLQRALPGGLIKARLAGFLKVIFGGYFDWRDCPNIAQLKIEYLVDIWTTDRNIDQISPSKYRLKNPASQA